MYKIEAPLACSVRDSPPLKHPRTHTQLFSLEIKLYASGVMLLDLLTQHNDCSHMKIVIMEVWYYCTKYADSTHNSFHEKLNCMDVMLCYWIC